MKSANYQRGALIHFMLCMLLIFMPVRAMAQSLPDTPPDQLALQMAEGNSYYFDDEFLPQGIYNVKDSVIDPAGNGVSESVRKLFADAGIIDQFVSTTYFTPDFINSPMYPDGPSSIIVQVRVLTFPSDQQAADYVNKSYSTKVAELRDSQATISATDLQNVPWNDQAVAGYTTPSVATDTASGLNIEYLLINYAGQHGSIVVMSRVIAPPDLAEPIAREMYYAQMECAQIDAPCGSFMIPVGEFPLTSAIETQNGGGSTSTSVGEVETTASADESMTSPAADSSLPTTATSGILDAFDLPVDSSGNWVLLPQSRLRNNVTEALPLRGTNDNLIVAWVANLEGEDRVVAVFSFLAPELGTPTLIEDGGTYMLHVVDVNGVAYGIFSTVEVASTVLDSIVMIYMAPLSTFGVGMGDVQSSVVVDGMNVFPNVDGAALVPAFGGAAGDPVADAALPPLIGE